MPVIHGFGFGTIGGAGRFRRIISRATISTRIAMPPET